MCTEQTDWTAAGIGYDVRKATMISSRIARDPGHRWNPGQPIDTGISVSMTSKTGSGLLVCHQIKVRDRISIFISQDRVGILGASTLSPKTSR
jgi:hypothetical protein